MLYWHVQMRDVVERGLRQAISSSPDMLRHATRHWGQPAGMQRVFRKVMQGRVCSSTTIRMPSRMNRVRSICQANETSY